MAVVRRTYRSNSFTVSSLSRHNPLGWRACRRYPYSATSPLAGLAAVTDRVPREESGRPVNVARALICRWLVALRTAQPPRSNPSRDLANPNVGGEHA